MKSTDVNIPLLFAMMKIHVLLITVTWNLALAYILILTVVIITLAPMTSALKEYVKIKKLIVLIMMIVLKILAMK